MAHRIFTHDRQEGTVKAWHGLTVIRPDLDLDHNFLTEWDIAPRKVFIAAEDGSFKQIPFTQLVCTDKPDLLVGAPYNPETFFPVTNAKFLEMIKNAVSGTDHKLVSIGSVRNRGRTFVSFELQALEKYTAGGRRFEPYLNFGQGHDKSSVLWTNTSSVCTVCDNTFTSNLFSVERADKSGSDTAGDEQIKVQSRHTRNLEAKLPEITKIVEAAVGVQAEFATAFESFAEQPISETRARRIFTGFVAAKNVKKGEVPTRTSITVDSLVSLFKRGAGNDGRNVADLFSAGTDYYTHSNARGNDIDAQVYSSEFGTGAKRKQELYALLRNPEKLEKVEDRGALLLA